MRTVCLSNSSIQEKINRSFVPLKVKIDFGTTKFPIDWPALKNWQYTYSIMGGSKTKGITACIVVSPDSNLQLGTTGSAFVWELFDSVAYDPIKFEAMLDLSLVRFARYEEILSNKLSRGNSQELSRFRRELNQEMAREGRFHLPPRGFTVDSAKDLFRLSGDLKDASADVHK